MRKLNSLKIFSAIMIIICVLCLIADIILFILCMTKFYNSSSLSNKLTFGINMITFALQVGVFSYVYKEA